MTSSWGRPADRPGEGDATRPGASLPVERALVYLALVGFLLLVSAALLVLVTDVWDKVTQPTSPRLPGGPEVVLIIDLVPSGWVAGVAAVLGSTGILCLVAGSWGISAAQRTADH